MNGVKQQETDAVTSTAERVGDWIQTFTGRQFWPIDPKPEEIDIRDIAHSLSLQCRFSGHCLFHYSVAQHSLGVVREVALKDPASALWALLHDASEAYLVDLPRPLKRYSKLGDEYLRVEDRLMEVICEKFGLPTVMPESVKRADNLLLAMERRDIMGPCSAPWRAEDAAADPLPIRVLVPMTPRDAENQFLYGFESLYHTAKGGFMAGGIETK